MSALMAQSDQGKARLNTSGSIPQVDESQGQIWASISELSQLVLGCIEAFTDGKSLDGQSVTATIHTREQLGSHPKVKHEVLHSPLSQPLQSAVCDAYFPALEIISGDDLVVPPG